MECKTLSIWAREIAHHDRLLLTANRRLATYHQKCFNQEQIQLEKSSWQNSPIIPLKNWLQTLWYDHCQTEAVLLSELQEQEVWQGIILKHQSLLLDLKTTAQLAKSAYETLALWNFSVADIPRDANEQVAEFYQWALKFENICQKNHWKSFGQIIKELQNRISDLPLPEKIYLDGFDDLAPAYDKIFSDMKNPPMDWPKKPRHETPILGGRPSSGPHPQTLAQDSEEFRGTTKKILLADNEAEMWAMAQWAKNQLEKNPHINIGCIVPNLAQIRDRVDYIFTKVFAEEYLLEGYLKTRHIFNLSAGASLMSYDIIRMAKIVLDLVEGECELEKLGALLQSPYLCSNDYDTALGARCHAALLNLGAESLPLSEIYAPLSAHFEHYSQSTWLARLRAFSECTKILSPRSPSLWADFFSEALEGIGWPGRRSLDSQDYQLCTRFYKSLSEFSALDLIYPSLTFTKARQIFNELLNTTIFQPQSVPANIQILGTLESAGFYFDAIWIMGLHDEAWPQVAKPNPFLPYEFQKKNNMPHATPARELRYAKQVLHRLLQSAPIIVLSSPQREGDKILQQSELIKDIPDFSASFQKSLMTEKPFSGTENPMELIDDYVVPPLTPEENIRGGSWIIKQQAICPFRAFASVRLKAQALPQTGLGLTPSERGILLHRCLEKIWRELKDHNNLLSKSTLQLNTLINSVTHSVLENFENTQAKPREKFLKTEQKRLEKILLNWLDFEKTRSTFTVAATESQFKVEIGKLNLHVQVDRIDQLENGQLVMIDYKTGNCQVSDWLGDRPQDPQLPLYCTYTHINDREYSGISFAVLKPGNLQFKGIIEGDEKTEKYLPGVMSTTTWDAQRLQWREAIEKLSIEFSSGLASVTPHDQNSCQYCDVKSLCRIGANPRDGIGNIIPSPHAGN